MDIDKKIKKYINYKLNLLNKNYKIIDIEIYSYDKNGIIREYNLNNGQCLLDYEYHHNKTKEQNYILDTIKKEGYRLNGTTFYYNHEQLTNYFKSC